MQRGTRGSKTKGLPEDLAAARSFGFGGEQRFVPNRSVARRLFGDIAKIYGFFTRKVLNSVQELRR